MGISLEQAQKEIKELRSELSSILSSPKYMGKHWLDGRPEGIYSEDQEARLEEIKESITNYEILSGMIIFHQIKAGSKNENS